MELGYTAAQLRRMDHLFTSRRKQRANQEGMPKAACKPEARVEKEDAREKKEYSS